MGFKRARRGFLGAWDGVARGGDAAFICIGLYRAESRFCGVLPGAWCLTGVDGVGVDGVGVDGVAVFGGKRADLLFSLYIEWGATFFLANHANPRCTLSRFAR